MARKVKKGSATLPQRSSKERAGSGAATAARNMRTGTTSARSTPDATKSGRKTAAPGRTAGRQRDGSARKSAAAAPSTRAKISSKHQVTIGKAPFDEAGFKSGDVVVVRATGRGRVELTRLDLLLETYRGSLSTGGELRKLVEESRDDWD